MTYQNIKKVEKNYKCEFCDYETYKKNNFEKHLTTQKHKILTNTHKKVANFKEFVCNCGKQYKHRQSLFNHKKKCNKEINLQCRVMETIENKKLEKLVVHLIKENTEIKEIVKKQQEQISELIPKIGNTTHNTINNKFNINVFLNEKCKDAISINDFVQQIEISLKNLLTTREKGLGIGLSEIINENMNKLSVYERPIHCTDKKREILYIKNDSWEKDKDREKTKEMLKDLQSQQFKSMQIWIKENPDYMTNDNLKHDYMLLVNKCSSSLNDHEKKIVKNMCENIYLNEQKL